MALIECPECGSEISSQAPTCPHCAFPSSSPSAPSGDLSRESSEPILWRTGLSVAARAFVGIFVILVANEGGGEEAAIFSGLLIAGSALPALYRGRMEWLRSKGRSVFGEPMEKRIAEMDRNYQDQIERLGQEHGDRVAELEERLDFAERMLTKGRKDVG